jgi:hypothetical protein
MFGLARKRSVRRHDVPAVLPADHGHVNDVTEVEMRKLGRSAVAGRGLPIALALAVAGVLALAVEPSGRLVAYVCNGDPDDLLSKRHYGEWYSGGIDGGTARLTATPQPRAAAALPVATGTVKFIRAEQTADGFVGTVAIADGTSNTFTAEAATAPAGLYREVVVAGANGIDIGWVSRGDGTVVGHARRLGGFSDVSGRVS